MERIRPEQKVQGLSCDTAPAKLFYGFKGGGQSNQDRYGKEPLNPQIQMRIPARIKQHKIKRDQNFINIKTKDPARQKEAFRKREIK